MSLLLLHRNAAKPAPPPEPAGTLRNRVGIANLYKAAMARGEKVTLERAIEILRAGW